MAAQKDRVVLRGSERQIASGATDVGAANADQTIDVTIRLRAKADPSIPPAHSRMSREEYENQYGASQADIQAVEDFAGEHGLTVISSDPPRRTMIVRGTVAQLGSAFGVELRQYDHPRGPLPGKSRRNLHPAGS